jgi:thymidylate synthase (FAD)
MKIINPSYVYINQMTSGSLTAIDGVRMLKHIERMGRVSHMSEHLQNEDSWKKFIPAVVLNHGDWSIAEHASLTAMIRTDRGITHELVRHRLFAFTQESTRFVRYRGALEFIYPTNAPEGCFANWDLSVQQAENTYFDLLDSGWRPQEARSVLPNSLAATIAVTGNLRNWRHFFLMRTSKETHPDFKRISIPMLAEIKQLIPFLYDDIEADQRQVENLRKPR